MCAMKTLSQQAEDNLKSLMALPNMLMAPTICVDNIDLEQRVHDTSVGHRLHTFRGTWGYIHMPDEELIRSLDASELSIKSYLASLDNLQSFTIQPAHFWPS